MRAAQTWTRLIFDWRPEGWDFRLPILIAISLIVHICTFYLFQVTYPATTSLLPPAARISVLDPKNSDDQRMLNWVEVHDPAAISYPGFRSQLIGRLIPAYRPSYASFSPVLRPMPAPADQTESSPSIFSTESLLSLRKHAAPSNSPIVFSSHLQLNSDLQGRLIDSSGKPPGASRLLEPSSFFLGLNKQGQVEYLFLWKSSGNSTADADATKYLRSLKFRATKGNEWGMAELRWGSN